MNHDFTKRLEYLVGEEKINKLNQAKVMVCGCGGVGSFVAEALARSGVGHLILVDFDIVDITNLNRQLMTTKDSIGKKKVEVLKDRIEAISDAYVEIRDCFIDEDFEISDDLDYVVDCIDVLTSKFALVKKCHRQKVKVISSLGTAKRIKIENIKYTTLDKTRNDPLARNFRNLVKKEKYNKKIEVVYIDSPSIQVNFIQDGYTNKEKYPIGSSIFTVGSAALYIAQIVCTKLMEE